MISVSFSFGEDILPKIIGHNSVRGSADCRHRRYIPCQRAKPTVFPCKLRAELYAGIVYGKMHHAALELKKHLARVTVIFILLNGIINILLCDLIL